MIASGSRLGRIIFNLAVIALVACSHAPKYQYPATFQQALEKTLPSDTAVCMTAWFENRMSWDDYYTVFREAGSTPDGQWGQLVTRSARACSVSIRSGQPYAALSGATQATA
jgi:hypothetical protein